ncbi:MAG: O-antigen ligase family protein [Actinobacteria bacterium]|nr:O-antigen ligase family protein [Actinomycetota bacterium]
MFSYFARFQILDRFIGIEAIRAYDPIYTLAPGRAVGTLGLASNFLGAYMLIPAALILGFGTIASRRRDIAAWSALYVLVFWALALTYTRASLIAIVVGAVGYFLWTRRTRMLPAFALALVSVILFTPFLSRFSLGNDRARLTSQAIEVIREHPVSGVGAGEYTPAETSRPTQENQPDGPDRSITPHNSFLLYASELGIPGGLLALLAVALPFLGALGRSPRGPFDSPAILAVAIAAGLGSFALQTLSNNLLHIPVVTVQFWIAATVGVLVSLHADGPLARRMSFPIRLR